jgi:hypothetical protein
MSGRDLTLSEARSLCHSYRMWAKARDTVVRDAVDAGLSKATVHALTGIARSTIDTILARTGRTTQPPAASSPAPSPREEGRATASPPRAAPGPTGAAP